MPQTSSWFENMPLERTSKTRFINDIEFTDEDVWIFGKIKEKARDYIVVEDETGNLRIGLEPEEDEAPCIIKGTLKEGAIVRVIGRVIAQTNKEFTVAPSIIHNLDELEVNEELLLRIRNLEEKFKGEQ